MKKLILSFLVAPLLLISQPSFTVTDSNGDFWESASLLAEGKTIVVTFFSPSETCWPSANHITKLSEAYNSYYMCNDLFFIQVAQWGNEYTTTNFVEQFGNPYIPAVVGYNQGQELTMAWLDWGLLYAYETWLLRPDGSYVVDIPFAWDLDQQVLIDALQAEGFNDCGHSMFIEDSHNTKYILKTIDLLGRDATQKGFNIEIYNDGSVQKKYVIE